jgi:hypothetical protein
MNKPGLSQAFLSGSTKKGQRMADDQTGFIAVLAVSMLAALFLAIFESWI